MDNASFDYLSYLSSGSLSSPYVLFIQILFLSFNVEPQTDISLSKRAQLVHCRPLRAPAWTPLPRLFCGSFKRLSFSPFFVRFLCFILLVLQSVHVELLTDTSLSERAWLVHAWPLRDPIWATPRLITCRVYFQLLFGFCICLWLWVVFLFCSSFVSCETTSTYLTPWACVFCACLSPQNSRLGNASFKYFQYLSSVFCLLYFSIIFS